MKGSVDMREDRERETGKKRGVGGPERDAAILLLGTHLEG